MPARPNSKRLALTRFRQCRRISRFHRSKVIIRDAIVSGQPYVAKDLKQLLQPFGPPACYLDFEAMMPPIPLYEGTRPYQTIPFQWSLHSIDADGAIAHKEFLADGINDPRRQFAETLIEALATSDVPIIVYSRYEQTRLRELATDFSDLGAPLDAAIARLRDLLPIVRSAVYRRESASSPIARKTCDGSGIPEAHAAPVEIASCG